MKKFPLKILLLVCIVTLTSSCSSDDTLFAEGLPDAIVNDDPEDAPPRGFDENWDGHAEKLYRQYFDDDVAVYYDDSVERPLEWPYEFLSDSWEYVTDTYGGFGDDNILYGVFHPKGASQPYIGTMFDEESSNRNLIDLPLNGEEMSASNMDDFLKAISQIVETSSNAIEGSPAAEVSGDKFSEIFVYDIYKNLEMEDEAQRVSDTYNQSTVNYPVNGTNWFHDWFFPIYDTYGGGKTLSSFFQILSKKYPVKDNEYSENMNLGEFVHFWSAAAGEDLEPLAENAFEWNDEYNQELRRARADFPTLDYPFEPTSKLIDLTGDATINVSIENGKGKDADEGSLSLIDDDIRTKFYTKPYSDSEDFWIEQAFDEAEVADRYTLTSGNDSPERDPKSWELVGSNDGDSWELLDERTDQSWNDREQTLTFNFDNTKAYKYYRINVLANNGESSFQLSEWRMLNLKYL